MKKVLFLFVLVFACALTLASCVTSCVHELGEWETTKPATCSAAGERQRKCTKCDYVETEELPIDPEAHQWGAYTATTPATCGTKGEEKRVCELCLKEDFREVEATGDHHYGAWVVDIEPYKGVDGREKCVCEDCLDVQYRPLKDTRVYANDAWFVAGTDKAAYEYVDETIVCLNEEIMSNENHYDVGHVNMNIMSAAAPTYFVMNAKIKGTITEPLAEGNDVYAGLVFDYEDEDNYRALLVRWTTWDRPNEIRSFFFIKVEDGVYTNLGDNWCDGCDVKPGSSIEIKLTKALTINGEVVSAELSAKGGTWSKKASTTFVLKEGKCGICGANDNFVYSNITCEENKDVQLSAVYNGAGEQLVIQYALGTYMILDGASNIKRTGAYTLAGKKATLKADGQTDLVAILGEGTFEYEKTIDYEIVATLKNGETYTVLESVKGDSHIKFSFDGVQAAGMTEDTKVGVYFKFDDDNFFEPLVQWGVTRGGYEEIRQLSVQGNLNGAFVGWNDGWNDGNKKTPADGGTVECSIHMADGKTVVAIKFTSGDYTFNWSREFNQIVEGAYAIQIFGKGTENFAIHDIETSITDGQPITIAKDAENIEIDFDCVGTVNAAVTTGTATGVEFYADGDNYVKCYAAWETWDRSHEIRNLEVTGKVGGNFFAGGEWHDAFADGCGVHPGDDIHYNIKKVGGKFTITVTVGEWSKVDEVTDAAFNDALNYVINIYGYGDTFTITNLTIK